MAIVRPDDTIDLNNNHTQPLFHHNTHNNLIVVSSYSLNTTETPINMYFAMGIEAELKATDSLDISRTIMPVLSIAPPSILSLTPFRFFTLAAEQRNEIYHLILREMRESGAIVTITEGGNETYYFPLPKEYSGLALASKQAYQEFTSLATKVYTTADFENDKKADFDSSKMLKRPFKVKAIVFNKQPIDVHTIPMMRFQLTGGLQSMTNLMRWSLTSIYLRHVEANVELRDGLGNSFIGKFTFCWGDDVSQRVEGTRGTKECSMAMGQVEKNVRAVVYRMRNYTRLSQIRPAMNPRYCKWLEHQPAGVASGANTLIIDRLEPGYTPRGQTYQSISITPRYPPQPVHVEDAASLPVLVEEEGVQYGCPCTIV